MPEFNNRRIPLPRGKVLGGSSSINGLIYIRGQKQDFDLWRQLGNTGWSYDDVLPYFRKAEDQEHGANEFHGKGGPLAVSDLRTDHPLHDAFVAGAKEAGYPYNRRLQRRRTGRRRSAAAYRAQAAALFRRGRLSEAGDEAAQPARGDPRAGASCPDRGQARRRRRVQPGRRDASGACAARSAAGGGAINSPQLLQLSGIGPGALLQQHGDRRWCTTCPASARTCRTISAVASSIAAYRASAR